MIHPGQNTFIRMLSLFCAQINLVGVLVLCCSFRVVAAIRRRCRTTAQTHEADIAYSALIVKSIRVMSGLTIEGYFAMNFDDYQREGQAHYARLADTVARIFEVVLGNVLDIRVQQIQSRAKSVKSLRTKLDDRDVVEGDNIEASVKDLAGCRIVCYTNADVARLVSSRIIGDNFEVDWDRTKFHYPPSEPTSTSLFISYNYVLKLKEERVALPEYSEHRDMWCEVQVQTTLDHAWSEMAHDTIYKRLPGGFGSNLMKDVEARMARTMEKYLRPAGIDFQKVANDVEQLRRGRKLYEADPISVLNKCQNNNELHDLLHEYKEHVLPYLDDVGNAAPIIRDCMVSVAIAARSATVVPTQYGFDGYTRDDILESALDVIDQLRFRHEKGVEATFDALLKLWSNAEMPSETDRIVKSARGLAKNSLSAWQQIGLAVQQQVVEQVQRLSADQIKANRSLVIAVLDEVLKFEVGGTTWSFDSVTIHRGAARASDALREIRQTALDTLRVLFRASEEDEVRRTIKRAFSHATRPPSTPDVDADLMKILLRDAIGIVSFYREIAGQLSFELLQSLEHDLFWLYRHRGRPRAELQEKPSIVELHDELARGIIAFRDQVNADRHFVIYKTLVGFESVFPPMWDGEKDIKEKNDYRKTRISQLVGDVSAENAGEWFDIITRCARTRSNDGATFPSFKDFLEELAREKPDLTLKLIANMDPDLARFLPFLLKGLAIGGRIEDIAKLTDRWLHERTHLPQIAIYCSIAPSFDADLLERAISLAMAEGDSDTVIRAMEATARQSTPQDELVERIFLPGLRYLASKRDTRWVGVIWPFAGKSAIISSLTGASVEEILTSLVAEAEVTDDVEWVLAVIARKWPVRVIDYFIDRLRLANSNDTPKEYDPVPFSLSELKEPMAKFAADMVQKLRDWYHEDETLFQYRGAQFATTVFPDFAPLETSFRSIVAEGERSDIEFVIAVLRAFNGQAALQPVCREIVAALNPDDELLNEIAVVLDATGVVSGQFGFVEAYQRKRVELEDWLSDPRDPVRAYAERHIRSLERAIAADQRRGMEEQELRKREYENLAENRDAAAAAEEADDGQ
ncbi:MAG: RelA/SpoT domain-containing protein [Hyphomicrobiales bacterium]